MTEVDSEDDDSTSIVDMIPIFVGCLILAIWIIFVIAVVHFIIKRRKKRLDNKPKELELKSDNKGSPKTDTKRHEALVL